jgi:hypothetical protein
MNVEKARRFLLKIQALLDQDAEQELSRLEKDLVKSYIQQLYEAVAEDPSFTQVPEVKSSDYGTKVNVPPPPPEHTNKGVKETIVETPEVKIPEYKPQKHQEVPVEIKYPEPEIVKTPQVEPPPLKERTKEPVHKMVPPPINEHVHPEESLNSFFESLQLDNVSERFSHIPIDDIQSAMGLNERIFTLKELFGGDKALFDATCEQLNHLHSLSEAKDLLMKGPARLFKWSEVERIKMAEQFIRIVARRYPKPGH